MADQNVEAEIAKRAEQLALALEHPETIARKLAEWVTKNYPERVAQAYWISAKRDRDKGLQVEIVKLPWTWADRLKLSLNGLIGQKTVGANLSSMVWQDLSGRWSVLVGVGAVSRYSDLVDGGKWQPVATIAVRVKL